jgi:putative ABC transport system permease protein
MGRLIIEVLLRFYPRGFRRDFAAELRGTIYRDRHRARNRAGFAWRIRFWTSLICDNLGAALRLRWDELTSQDNRLGFSGTLLDDVVQGQRIFLRNARFQLAAVFLLALGIGSSAAAFAVVDGVLLEDLPYPHPERLVQVGARPPRNPEWMAPLSEATFLAMRQGISQLEALAAVSSATRVLRGIGDPAEVWVGTVSTGYLDLLGARAFLGRTLQPSDHEAGATKVAVLSSTVFENRFGGDPNVLGSVLDLSGEPVEVVGVLSPEFLPPPGIRGRTAALWTPLGLAQRELSPILHLDVIGLVRPGATPATIQEEVSRVLAERRPAETPAALRSDGRVETLRSRVLGDTGSAILLAQGGLVLLLLLTCVNVASLLMARASERRPEMAIRSVLGARRERMIRQLLSESLFLAVLAGGGGVGLAVALVRWFKAMAPDGIPLLPTVTVDGEVLAFVLILSLVSSVLFGLLPALTSSRVDLAGILGKSGPGRTDSRAAAATLRFLVVGEVSLAVVLALGAGLLANSFFHLTRVDLGFQPDGLATMRVEMRGSDLNRENPGPFFRQLLDEGREISGVSSAALAYAIPILGHGWSGPFTPQDLDPSFGDHGVSVNINAISEGFFPIMRIPILEGRPLQEEDGEGGEPVVVVNRAFVGSYWPHVASAIGRTVEETGGRERRIYRVVGVVGDVRSRPGSGAEPTIFFPVDHLPDLGVGMSLLVRAEGNPTQLAAPLRDLVRRLDRSLPVPEVTTLTSLVQNSVVEPRFYALLAVGFALFALILALAGVYGTTSYAATRRTHEIGIRMALGADRGRVLRGILTGTFCAAIAGVTLGLLGGGLGAKYLGGFLFGIEPLDVPTYTVVALVIGVTVITSAFFPALRVAGLNPAVSLRREA